MTSNYFTTEQRLLAENVRSFNYSELVGLVQERNRPSGGITTISNFVKGAFITSEKTVLEVGSNTGFAIVQIAALSNAACVGIDINKASIIASEEYARKMGVDKKVQFVEANALQIPFPDGYFDALWVSNVTSFIADKTAAINEYLRVLKPNGIIGFAPIYYRSTPPPALKAAVEALLGTTIDVTTLESWRQKIRNVAHSKSFQLVELSDDHFAYHDNGERIGPWVEWVLDKPHLNDLPEDTRDALRQRYMECMNTFNENLKYCGFSLLLYQKRNFIDEPELFTTYRV